MFLNAPLPPGWGIDLFLHGKSWGRAHSRGPAQGSSAEVVPERATTGLSLSPPVISSVSKGQTLPRARSHSLCLCVDAYQESQCLGSETRTGLGSTLLSRGSLLAAPLLASVEHSIILLQKHTVEFLHTGRVSTVYPWFSWWHACSLAGKPRSNPTCRFWPTKVRSPAAQLLRRA